MVGRVYVTNEVSHPLPVETVPALYQYRCFESRDALKASVAEADSVEFALNALGQGGWELAGIDPDGHIYLKRHLRRH